MSTPGELVDACHTTRAHYITITQAWVQSGLDFIDKPDPVNLAMYRMRSAQMRRAEAEVAAADAALLRSYGLEPIAQIKSYSAQAIFDASVTLRDASVAKQEVTL